VTDGLDVLEETRAFNTELRRSTAGMPQAHTLPPDATRRAQRDGNGIFPGPVFLEKARWETVDGRAREIRLRVLDPPEPARGTYLHVHGGGFVLGAADMQDVALQAFAESAAVKVVSIEYRLAPEHPWPAGADDCEDAALALVERGDGPLMIGGESAGAHLSATTLLRLRDRHGIDVRETFAGANLVFGVYDFSGTPSRRAWHDDLVMSSATMDWFHDQLLPGATVETYRSAEVSPLYADLTRLPPAVFTVGTRDPLLDDSLFMAARWQAAGNESALRVWAEGAHGFTAFPIEIARRARAEQYAFVRRVLA